MHRHENLHWEIVNNPHVPGERIHIVKRSDDGCTEPGAQSPITPETILFRTPPKAEPANGRITRPERP